MAKERPAEIRGLFNIPVISRKILLPKIINKNPRINLKEKKDRRKRIWFTAKHIAIDWIATRKNVSDG
jgi:hypothetical protein